jgi:uncharacterized protein YebE (UPF0316 family)
MDEWHWWIPFLIYAARICDVSIGTVRSVFVISGYRKVAVILGFFEVIIWVLAVGWALKHISHPTALIGYAGGYASGILIGMTVEDRVAMGLRMIRVINPDPEVHVAAVMRERGFRVTRLDGSGQKGPVEVSFMVIKRRRLGEVKAMLAELAPEAFITVERVDRADGGSAGGNLGESRFGRRVWERVLPVRV